MPTTGCRGNRAEHACAPPRSGELVESASCPAVSTRCKESKAHHRSSGGLRAHLLGAARPPRVHPIVWAPPRLTALVRGEAMLALVTILFLGARARNRQTPVTSHPIQPHPIQPGTLGGRNQNPVWRGWLGAGGHAFENGSSWLSCRTQPEFQHSACPIELGLGSVTSEPRWK